MATNKPQIKGYISEENAAKFKIIAKKEKRSTSNLIEVLIEKAIEEYEKENGPIILGDDPEPPKTPGTKATQKINNSAIYGNVANIGENSGTINM